MGSIEGVLDTRSAWIGEHEVVKVTFAPAVVTYDALLKVAAEKGCATRAWTTTEAQANGARMRLGELATALTEDPRDAKESDQLYYLRDTAMRYLPLTPLQARRVNGALFQAKNPEKWLSPGQIALLDLVETKVGKHATALKGLVRPTKINELASYSRKLKKALTK